MGSASKRLARSSGEITVTSGSESLVDHGSGSPAAQLVDIGGEAFNRGRGAAF